MTAIEPRELAELSKSGRPIDLIDVRTPEEYREVHVEGAKCVPLGRLDPAAVMQSRVGPAGDTVYVVCRSGGCGAQTCERFAGAGFPNVVNVEGGTLACVEAGLPVARGAKAISLERQVRIAAGSLVLLGAALGAIAYPAFVGAGVRVYSTDSLLRNARPDRSAERPTGSSRRPRPTTGGRAVWSPHPMGGGARTSEFWASGCQSLPEAIDATESPSAD